MPKMESLRWIPMVIQAYQAAKTRLHADQPMINISSDQMGAENHPAASQSRQQSDRIAKKPVETRGAGIRSKKLTTTKQVSSTSRLIRELRAANRKLNRLETIQQQLRAMESMFAGLRNEIQQSAPETKQAELEKESPNRETFMTNQDVMFQKDNQNRNPGW